MTMRLVSTCVGSVVRCAAVYLLCWYFTCSFMHALHMGRVMSSRAVAYPLLELLMLWSLAKHLENASGSRVPAAFAFPVVIALGILILLAMPY